MNKTTKGYNVNFAEKKIIITKAFATKAGTYDTPEFNAFVGLRTAFPDFAIEYKEIKKKEDKVSYKGLSIEKMMAFIQIKESKEAAMEFSKYVAVYTGEKGKYPTIKKMFLAKYKDAYSKLTTDEMMELEVLADKIREEKESCQDNTQVEIENAA